MAPAKLINRIMVMTPVITPAHVARAIAVVALGLLGIAWLTSLPIALPGRMAAWHNYRLGTPLITGLAQPPQPTDALALDLSIADTGVQYRYGYIVWSQRQPQHYSVRYKVTFAIQADGQPHRYIIPIGTHPEWRGDIHNVELVLLQPFGLTIRIADAAILARSPWALDAWLGRFLAPYVSIAPPWPYLVLFVGALLMVGLALAWPASHWRRRLVFASCALGGVTAVVVMIKLVAMVALLYRVYGSLDESTATARVLAYDVPTQTNQILIAAAASLPEGRVLMSTTNPIGYVVHRARYLFYPRRVEVIGHVLPAELRRQLANGYIGLVAEQPVDQPPLLGWQRVSPAGRTPAIWRAPGGAAPKALPGVGQSALIALLAGLGLVVLIGWQVADLAGARGWARAAYAWPVGVPVLAWWMFGLALINIAWSWWSIGLPIALGALLLSRRAKPRRQDTVRPIVALRAATAFEAGGALLLLVVLTCVILRATLLPFNDIDSWWVWALRGRGFYLDGTIKPLAGLYEHTRYPPAQSLVQTWGYLAMGGISERMIKIIFPIWYAACLGIVWLACRRWHSGPIAIGWTLLLATTPIMLDHATLGNADLPLAVGLLVGGVMLCDWLETGGWHALVGAMIALAGASWIKVDGIALGAGLLGAAIFVRMLALRRQMQPVRQTILIGVGALTIFLAIGMCWHVYMGTHETDPSIVGVSEGLQSGLIITPNGLGLFAEELFFSHSNSTRSLLGSGYGALWLVCMSVLITAWRRWSSDTILLFLMLSVGSGMLMYLAFYTFVPSEFIQPYFMSIERYFLHLAPLAALAAARATRPTEQTVETLIPAT